MKSHIALQTLLLFCCSSLLAQDVDVALVCKNAADHMRRLESIAAFKLHGTVHVKERGGSIDSTHEVWLEARGDKVWSRLLEKPKMGTPEEEQFRKYAELLKTDLAETLVFDGKQMFSHSPIRLQVRIEVAETFRAPMQVRHLFPVSWTGFSFNREQGKTTFEVFLTSRLPESEAIFDRRHYRVVVSHKLPATDSSTPLFHTDRRVEIDPSSFMIHSSKISGGKVVPIDSELEWRQSKDVWYVSKGRVTYPPFTVEWEIDEFSADPRDVRTSFALEKSKLPLGTRIDIDPFNKQKMRKTEFVGGSEGQREYELKRGAIGLIAGTSNEGK